MAKASRVYGTTKTGAGGYGPTAHAKGIDLWNKSTGGHKTPSGKKSYGKKK